MRERGRCVSRVSVSCIDTRLYGWGRRTRTRMRREHLILRWHWREIASAPPKGRNRVKGGKNLLQPLRDRAPTRDSASGAQRQREADARTLLAGHVPKRGIVWEVSRSRVL